jgi:hypothetical protein
MPQLSFNRYDECHKYDARNCNQCSALLGRRNSSDSSKNNDRRCRGNRNTVRCNHTWVCIVNLTEITRLFSSMLGRHRRRCIGLDFAGRGRTRSPSIKRCYGERTSGDIGSRGASLFSGRQRFRKRGRFVRKPGMMFHNYRTRRWGSSKS